MLHGFIGTDVRTHFGLKRWCHLKRKMRWQQVVSRCCVLLVKILAYRSQYQMLFGKFPEVVFSSTINNIATPLGSAQSRDAWFRIPINIQIIINEAYANVGKSIAAYERTLNIPKTRFDEYLEEMLVTNKATANEFMSEDERLGLKLFLDESRTHCIRCHNGPLFSDAEFHNIGTGNFHGKKLDFGRVYGISAVVQDEFNCIGNYSDADPEDCFALRFLPNQIHNDLYGAFKTPTLRYLNKTSPYFHDGRFETLADVIESLSFN